MRALALFLMACEPVCEPWNVLRADLTPPGDQVLPPGTLAFGAGGTRHKSALPAPEPFLALTDAVLKGAPDAQLRWSAQLDQHLLIAEHPLTLGATVAIGAVDNSGRFTGGYEGFGWWAGDWALVAPGPPKAALYVLFEDQPSTTAVSGTAFIAQTSPLLIDLNLSLTDRKNRLWAVVSRARFSLRQGEEICQR